METKIHKVLTRIRINDIFKYTVEKSSIKKDSYLVCIKMSNGDNVQFYLSRYSDVEKFIKLVAFESTLYIISWKDEGCCMAEITSSYAVINKHFD